MAWTLRERHGGICPTLRCPLGPSSHPPLVRSRRTFYPRECTLCDKNREASQMPNIPQLARKQKSHSGEKTSPSLLDALRNNQPDGWFRLDRLYHPLVCFWCARLGANREDVSDICQTV